MKRVVIVSSQDPAGMNIKKHLLELKSPASAGNFDGEMVYRFESFLLYTIREFCIYAEHIDKKIQADLIVFATTHKSRENVPALTCHAIGNWDEVKLGGKAKTLGVSSAELWKKAFLSLKNNSIEGYETTIEATHHGPYVDVPALFMEIGSTEKEWNDPVAGKAMAKAILETFQSELPPQRIALALGGPHYGNNFMKIMERTDIAIGHLCPKHMLPFLDENLLKQTIGRIPGCKTVIFDWKGMGQEKERLKELCESLGLEILRTDKV